MTLPRTLAIADAVVAAANASNFLGVTAVRRLSVEFDASSDALQAVVVPATHSTEDEARDSTKHEYMIQIGLRKRVESDAEGEAVLLIMEQVCDYLLEEANRNQGGGTLVRVDDMPVWDPVLLREAKVLLTVAQLHYEVSK